MTCRCPTPCRSASCEMHRQHTDPDGIDWDGILCVAVWIVFFVAVMAIGSTLDWRQ